MLTTLPALVLASALPTSASPVAVRVTFGHADNIGRDWSGSVAVDGGTLLGAEGWMLEPGESVSGEGAFSVRSPAPDPAAYRSQRPGTKQATFFWAKDTSGPYQGFGVPRRIDFSVPPGQDFQQIRLTPEWAADREAIKIRFDPPAYAEWEIDAFRIIETAGERIVKAWEFDRQADLEDWTANPSISGFRVSDGALRGTGTGPHPVLQSIGAFPVTETTIVEVLIRWTALGEAPVTGPAVHQGFIMRASGEQWRARVSTNRGDLAFSVADLAPGAPAGLLDGAVRAELVPDATLLSQEATEDDYPGICASPGGGAVCAWVSHREDEGDHVLLSRCTDDTWSAPEQVTEALGDIHRARTALDGSGGLWVIWSEQLNGCWTLRARSLADGTWSRVRPLTSDPGPNIMHEVATASDGSVWVTWQSGREGNFDIYLKRFDGRRWSRDIQVTSDPANDWEPSLAIDSAGRVHVVWDTYRSGSYDVYHALCADGRVGEPSPVAASPAFEAHASVACDALGRAWVAWDEGDARWGKDWGMTMEDPPGNPLHATRRLGLAVITESGPRQLAASPYSAIPSGEDVWCEHPQLAHGPDGRLWLMYRYPIARSEAADRALVLVGAAWGAGALAYDGDTWQRMPYLPHSEGRDDESVMSLASGPGAMWFAWSTDGRPRGTSNYLNAQLYAGSVPTSSAGQASHLSTAALGEPMEAGIRRPPRRADTNSMTHGGRDLLLLWGDLHRHTEISADGHKDGTLFEAYRYCIDAAEMDFLGVADHNAGGDREYPWYRTQQSCDLFAVQAMFTPIYGYERSLPYPNGHRNVFQANRGVRTVPMFKGPDGRIAPDDTQQLYETIRRDGGLSIPHTIATDQGTDWRDNDPALEPVLEIFQGLRNESYEYQGAPGAITPDSRPAQSWGYQEAGFAWKAWEKGLRLGVIAASDHISTHISYAAVYSPSRSRDDILDAILARHTYGATDRISLDFRARTSGSRGEWLMGDDFSARGTPELRIRATGTSAIAQVDIVRDNEFIYTGTPNSRDLDFAHQDLEAGPGEHYYYVRLIQTDGQKAWSSPIWVTLTG